MLKTIDLFAGAGGLSCGFESTNKFIIVAAAENNVNARKTYIENHRGQNEIKMISDVRGYDFSSLVSEYEGIDVVIGGPPCQGFSNANRQKNHAISMNNMLVKEYMRAVIELQPIAFVMENVSMLKSDVHRFYMDKDDEKKIEKYNIPFDVSEIELLDKTYYFDEAIDIVKSLDDIIQHLWDEKIYYSINVIYKTSKNNKKLQKLLKDREKQLISLLNGIEINSIDYN